MPTSSNIIYSQCRELDTVTVYIHLHMLYKKEITMTTHEVDIVRGDEMTSTKRGMIWAEFVDRG